VFATNSYAIPKLNSFSEDTSGNLKLVTMVLCTGCQGPVREKNGRVVHCNILEGGGCLACKEDIALEQKIQELQERRQELRTKMNASHDPFVLKLPPEVASYIFLLSVEEWDPPDISQRSGGLPTPFLLGAICSGWRQLARSTPALWTRLAFTLPRGSKMRKALPNLVADWLERSGGLPLTLKVSYCTVYHNPPPDRHGSVIDALNQHSGRWCDVEFTLPSDYVGRLCGSSPPEYLCNLSILSDDENETDKPLTFRMNARPNPMKFKIFGFLLEGVDVAWDNLVHLDLNWTTFDGILQIIRDAPLLEICSLSFISPPIDDFRIPEIIICHPYLRTLKLIFLQQTSVFHRFINSLELPSLESWSLEFHDLEESIVVDIMTSFIKRSGCSLKTLDIEQNQAAAVEDFERFLQALPYLQHLRVACSPPLYDRSLTPVMDNILERISASPAMQTRHTVGFLPGLQSLQLSGHKLNTWACIPLIFRLPHRKLLKVDITMNSVTIGDDDLEELVELVDQGIELDIYDCSRESRRVI
jgi:hypothetical protein